MPERVEASLLVVEPFKDSSGLAWQTGDRASLARSAVRRAALERPELFRVEYGTEELDPQAEWFKAIAETYEARYAEARRHRDGAEERRQQALRGVEGTEEGAARPGAPLQAAGAGARGAGKEGT